MGKLQINGTTIIQYAGNNFNEGLRINRAADNFWSIIHLGGAKDSVEGTCDGGWLLASNANGNFVLTHNGSSDNNGLVLQKNSAVMTYKGNTILHSANYTSYTVTKTGSGASGTWGINISGNATTSSIPLGFSYRETSWTWGTLTAANGYTLLTDWISPASGGLAFADKGSQVSCQIDGYFYQNEGQYMVLDANNYTSYAPTRTGSGASGTWGISITGNANTATSASSASLLSIHNNVTNTATRSTFASTWNGSVSGLKYVWGQSWKDTSISSDPGDLVLGLRPAQYSSGTELCMMIDGDYYAMGNKVLHAGNWSSYCAPASHSHSYLPLSGGTVNGTVTATGQPGFYISTGAGVWSYLRLKSGSNFWDVAVNSSQNDGALDFRPNGNNAGCYITRAGHLVAVGGLSWNHAYWSPNGNINCTPTGNDQEWSFDVGASGYTGCYWHVWSSKNGCSMLSCYADNNSVHIPNGPLVIGTKCYGGSLPSASYVGQIFFKI